MEYKMLRRIYIYVMKHMKPHELARQFMNPHGIWGYFIESYMGKKNLPAFEWVISELKIQPSDNVLEIGFGSGHAIKNISEIATNGFVAGVDISGMMVNIARRRNKSAVKRGKVELHHGDIFSVFYDENKFDKAFAINVLYFLEDPVKHLQKVFELLKPGGQIALYITKKDCMSRFQFTKTGLFTLYADDEVISLLKKSGFSKIQYSEKMINGVEPALCFKGEKQCQLKM